VVQSELSSRQRHNHDVTRELGLQVTLLRVAGALARLGGRLLLSELDQQVIGNTVRDAAPVVLDTNGLVKLGQFEECDEVGQ